MKKFMTMSLVLIIVAVILAGCGGGSASYEDGTYEGQAEGHNGPLSVSVEVTDGEISNVEVVEHEESDGIADPALEQIPASIEENNSTDVDAISEVTVTSEAIIEAVNDALPSE